MTAYKNFIQDFPTRCCEMLKDYEGEALSSGREVTLTLAMAASGLVVPFERLRDQEEPPYQDRSNYPEAASQFERLLEEKFLGSRLWEKEVRSWAFGGVRCVTEEIISKIGAMLPVKMARSKLARLSKNDVRFLSRNFVTPNQQQLVHGIELVARYFAAEPSEVEFAFRLQERSAEQEFHTIENVLTILKSLYPDRARSLEEGYAKMLAFDAFVGAPDRHAMNWGC